MGDDSGDNASHGGDGERQMKLPSLTCCSLLAVGLVPNRPRPSTVLGSGVGDPWVK